MKRKFRRRQRGVVLLVVLSLLTLFTLLMVTFIIVSGQYRQSALSAARASRADEAPAKLLDNATYALLRDSTDPKNAIRFHSLLFDMYGRDGFEGAINFVDDVTNAAGNPNDGTGGNFFDLRIAATVDMAGNALSDRAALDGSFNGCSLIVTASDVAQGRTFRVVDYRASDQMFRVMPIALSSEHSTMRPRVGDRIVVNGRPFNGTGFGYNPSTSLGSPQLNSAFALQPNQIGQTNPALLANFALGDADESYDAVDFQNMALAGVIPTATTIATDGVVVVPSFHRPELVNYWVVNGRASLDRAIMRPMPWDHPDFDGSNRELTLPKSAANRRPTDPLFLDPSDPGTPARRAFLSRLAGVDPSTGNRINSWDVDNDGDRIFDSVWVDIGFPVQTMPDGRHVKPLFAFLCVDLDGRINLNTAGSAGHITSLLGRNATTTLARGGASSVLPVGQGLGAAEINPGYSTTSSYPLFKNFDSNDQYYTMLLSRYGANGPGASGMDTFASVKLFEFPTDYYNGTTGKAYNSPPDLFGEFSVGVDHRGQPTYDTPQASRTDTLSNSPYEFDVTGLQRGRADNPFTVAELERVLRFNDTGFRLLPDRLTNLGGVPGNPSRRRSVTTDSYDVPVPPVLTPHELRTVFAPPNFSSSRPLHVSDLLAARLLEVNSSVTTAFVNAEVSKMLSWDLRAGTRMDVNRPFGNGQDDNGNGVVDEHGSTSASALEAHPDLNGPGVGEKIWSAGTFFNHDNDNTTTNDNYLARYHFAKHLYVLAMTLKEKSVAIDFDGIAPADPPSAADQIETARGLAQWAVNVVDFRDADSIMTPFEFDLNPFNGWDIDGVLGSSDDSHADRALVWGCERPELLITETLAFHDKRTEDLSTDPTGKKTDDATAPDDDFDQRLRPRGSLFIELYNPWTGYARLPAELYTSATAMAAAGVDLKRVAPGGAPVWRMIVVTGASHAGGAPLDPDDPATSGFNTSDVERGIYFADPSGAVTALTNEHRHYSTLPTIAPLEPGRFAVVGSGTQAGGSYVTTIGRRTDAEDDGQTNGTSNLQPGSTRRIVLTPDPSASTQQVQVLDNAGLNTPALTSIQPAIAVVLNTGGDLNISEPSGGYPAGANWDSTLASGEGAYTTPFDEPFDATPRGRDSAIADVLDNVAPTATTNPDDRNSSSVGTYPGGVCTVHLQRLANPLVPYNAASNPYRTIDHASIDLTVFDGVYDPNSMPPLPAPRTNPGESFGGRERGVAGVTPPHNRLWKAETTAAPANGPFGADPQVFNYLLDSTLGYSNDTFGPRFNTGSGVPPEYVGAPRTTFTGVDGDPFPWLTWNNRPFVSQHEMMLVPHSSSFRLTNDFSVSFRRVVDNSSAANFAAMGSWAPDTVPGGYSGDVLIAGMGTGTETAAWRFTGLTPGDTVELAITWTPGPTRATDAPFTVLDAVGGTPVSGPTRINQQMAPIGKSSDGVVWQILNSNLTVPMTGELVIQLDNNANGEVVADAVRLRKPPRIYKGQPQFGHLLNFFSTTHLDSGSGSWEPGSNLYRLFDYTHVPSRFIGTETWLDPGTFASGNGTALLHPPFDRVFSFREPGKVNINTIFEPRVWDAIRGPNSTLPDYASLVDSRRGYGSSGASAVVFDTTVPTFFGNPYRAPDAGDLVPVDEMVRGGVEATLLRSPGLTAAATEFERDGRFEVIGGNAHVDPYRNPYFRYRDMQRLSNLVTTRSNVYAIWVTMGMFEVTIDSNGSERLGQEAGRETGSVKRHRAFYIIDRSIPVAFQPGKNHNVDDAILLRRIIE